MIDIIAKPFLSHHVAHADALATGLGRHGLKSRIISAQDAATADVCACWGWRIGAPLVAAGKRVLVMERGYTGDRNIWTSFGWNGLNGRAQRAPAKDSNRFEKNFGYLLEPWNPQGNYSLLIGQVAGDASLCGIDFQSWAADTAIDMAKAFDLPVKYRPHPVAIEYGQKQTVPGCDTICGTLSDDISDAAVVVTFSSNAGVDAMLAGKPVVAIDKGAMAYPVAAHDLTIQSEPAQRRDWASSLAWCQFSMDEIRSGMAWEHVGA